MDTDAQPYADDLAICDQIIEHVEAAEAAYRAGQPHEARAKLLLASGRIRAHATGEMV